MINKTNKELQDLFFDFRTNLDIANSLINILTGTINNQFDIENKDTANLIYLLKKLIENININFEKLLNRLEV